MQSIIGKPNFHEKQPNMQLKDCIEIESVSTNPDVNQKLIALLWCTKITSLNFQHRLSQVDLTLEGGQSVALKAFNQKFSAPHFRRKLTLHCFAAPGQHSLNFRYRLSQVDLAFETGQILAVEAVKPLIYPCP